jgi:hypothetical protein
MSRIYFSNRKENKKISEISLDTPLQIPKKDLSL